jgi:opacity protein-like surface antigen
MLANKKLIISISSVFLFSFLISSNALAKAVSQHISSSNLAKGYYLGVFGGGAHVGDVSTSQQATAFFPVDAGGPLDVYATGNSGGKGAIVGMHIGYEWYGWDLQESSISNINPAVELEGYYLANKQHDYLYNPTDNVPEHFFSDNFPMNTGVLLANSVFSFKTNYFIDPYVGLGLGTAIISISDATSVQDNPPEYGVNHFNSNPDAHKWTFAVQAKAGIRYNLTKNLDIFAEYKLLYLNSTEYTFGSTQYPAHVPTTRWNVNIGDMAYSLGSVGFDYSI